MWAFAEAVSTVEVVQAITAMTLWKEPDDDKATFYFNRVCLEQRAIADHVQAVILAKELNLGQIPPQAAIDRMTESEQKDLRQRQRLW